MHFEILNSTNPRNVATTVSSSVSSNKVNAINPNPYLSTDDEPDMRNKAENNHFTNPMPPYLPQQHTSSQNTTLEYGNKTIDPLFSIPESILKSCTELEDIFILLNPAKGKATFMLAHFLNNRYQTPILQAFIQASELLKLETEMMGSTLVTLLVDGFEEDLATLLQLSHNLAR